ncbi:hypothetical protein CYMTET_28283, partial [Cymbomonas tetramitiformis]
DGETTGEAMVPMATLNHAADASELTYRNHEKHYPVPNKHEVIDKAPSKFSTLNEIFGRKGSEGKPDLSQEPTYSDPSVVCEIEDGSLTSDDTIKIIHHRYTDTKCMIYLRGEMIVVAFRGTSAGSMKNIKTDLNVVQCDYPVTNEIAAMSVSSKGLVWISLRHMFAVLFGVAWSFLFGYTSWKLSLYILSLVALVTIPYSICSCTLYFMTQPSLLLGAMLSTVAKPAGVSNGARHRGSHPGVGGGLRGGCWGAVLPCQDLANLLVPHFVRVVNNKDLVTSLPKTSTTGFSYKHCGCRLQLDGPTGTYRLIEKGGWSDLFTRFDFAFSGEDHRMTNYLICLRIITRKAEADPILSVEQEDDDSDTEEETRQAADRRRSFSFGFDRVDDVVDRIYNHFSGVFTRGSRDRTQSVENAVEEIEAWTQLSRDKCQTNVRQQRLEELSRKSKKAMGSMLYRAANWARQKTAKNM